MNYVNIVELSLGLLISAFPLPVDELTFLPSPAPLSDLTVLLLPLSLASTWYIYDTDLAPYCPVARQALILLCVPCGQPHAFAQSLQTLHVPAQSKGLSITIQSQQSTSQPLETRVSKGSSTLQKESDVM